MSVPFEVRLTAWALENGRYSILDIVETSRRNASFFARGFYRNPEVVAISALPAGCDACPLPRTITR